MATATRPAPATRVAIIDDVKEHRERLGIQARLAGYEGVLLVGKYKKVQDLVVEVNQKRVDGVLCDLRLSDGNFASFNGAVAVAALYDAQKPSVLITDYSNLDSNNVIRLHRRKIPVLIKMENVGREVLRLALEASRAEIIEGKPPISRRPRRALVMIDEVRNDVGAGMVTAFVPQWKEDEAIAFPVELVPQPLRRHLKKNAFLIADVNTDAEDAADLYFDNFELPPTTRKQK